jgi:hypothetical protein
MLVAVLMAFNAVGTYGFLANVDRDRRIAQIGEGSPYSTVTDFARLRGWSTSVPMMTAVW